MGKIIKMSPELANLIAAGEVVERPSSVIKELVENSIDASSKTIRIYLKNAGLDEIKVVDDGIGMDSDDVINAFLPHATSKIKNEYDLARIKTLGFRGEAVPSIAQVSTMTIESSQDGISGYMTEYKAGVLQKSGICNHNKGTTVTVKGLFFNTPARLKYMKSEKQELASIMFFINRISLAHTEIKFQVYHNDKIIFNTRGNDDFKSIIAQMYGLEAAKRIITSEYVDDGYNAKLIFIKPEIYRSNKLEITMIVNGRYVKNYNIINSIIDGFKTYLPIGKYPIGIIYFEIDPLLIDVNCHPTKTEIKISNEENILNRLKIEINNMLNSNYHIPNRVIVEKKYSNETLFNTYMEDNTTYSNDISNEPLDIYKTKIDEYEYKPKKAEDKKYTNEEYENIENKIDDIKEIKEDLNNKIPYMEYVGNVFSTYLIFENSSGMYLVDQHAAAERINYEKYYNIISNLDVQTTELLVPISLSYTKSEALYINDNINEFERIGFYLEAIGDTEFVVRRIPLWAKIDNIEDIISDILANMIDNHKIDVMYFRDKIAKQISCKASIKANHRISREEVNELINNLNKCKNPYTCPHGRPTIIKITVEDLEKMFERIQSK